MHGEIITIGDELISGRTLDINAWYVAGRLTASGLRITQITTVGDDAEKMSRALIFYQWASPAFRRLLVL